VVNAARRQVYQERSPVINEARQQRAPVVNAARRQVHQERAPVVNAARRQVHQERAPVVNAARRHVYQENSVEINRQRQERKRKRAAEGPKFVLNDETFVITEQELNDILEELKTGQQTMHDRKETHNFVFHDAGTSPLKALLLFYLNSGCARFDEWKYHADEFAGLPVYVPKMVSEVSDEQLSEEQLEDIIARFQAEHPYVPEHMWSCAACGLRVQSEKYEKVYIGDEHVEKFKYSDLDQYLHVRARNNPAASVTIYTNAETFKIVNAWDVKSVYRAVSGKLYHLHPELVEYNLNEEESLFLCEDCYPNKVNDETGEIILPERSIAAGTDFGSYHRLGLVEPNLHETNILSMVRLYLSVYKVSSNLRGRTSFSVHNEMKCHAIMFAHTAPVAVGESLASRIDLTSKEQIEKDFVVQFLDDKGKFDQLAQRINGASFLFARWWQLLSWLRVLRVTSKQWQKVEIPSETQLRNRINESLLAVATDAQCVTDRVIVEFDNAIGSDVAQVQQREPIIPNPSSTTGGNVVGESGDNGDHNNSINPTSVSDQDNQDMPVSVYYVLNNPSVYATEDHTQMRQSCLRAVARLANIDVRDRVLNNTFPVTPGTVAGSLQVPTETQPAVQNRDPVGSMRDSYPINEFTSGDTLPLAFPTTFMLGKAYRGKTARLGSRQLNHLLHQFTAIPGKDYRLLGYLRDVTSRFGVTSGVVAHMKNNVKAKKVMSELLHSETKQEELLRGIQEPKSKHLKTATRLYLPHLHFSGRNVEMGYFESFRLKSELMETAYRYGPPSGFITLSFNDIDNPRSFRATFRTIDNTKFPAMFEIGCQFGSSRQEFLANLSARSQLVSERQVQGRTLDRSSRARAAMANPVAYVDESKQLLADICAILFGLPLEHLFARGGSASRRKTWCYTCNKGVLGYTQALVGVMEEHARATLHYHIVFFGGLTPFVLQEFAAVPDICAAIVRVIDSQYQSTLPPRTLLGKLIADHVRFKIPGGVPSTQNDIPYHLQTTNLMDIVQTAARNEW
jgi:hypothetical protein